MRIAYWLGVALTALALAAALPAAARDHRGWDRRDGGRDHHAWRDRGDWRGHGGWHGDDGGHFFLGLNFGVPLYSPYYYPPPPAVVYEPPPVVVAPPPPVAYAPAPPPASAVPPGCREFHSTVTIGGRPQKAWGIACPQPDGTWKIIK